MAAMQSPATAIPRHSMRSALAARAAIFTVWAWACAVRVAAPAGSHAPSPSLPPPIPLSNGSFRFIQRFILAYLLEIPTAKRLLFINRMEMKCILTIRGGKIGIHILSLHVKSWLLPKLTVSLSKKADKGESFTEARERCCSVYLRRCCSSLACARARARSFIYNMSLFREGTRKEKTERPAVPAELRPAGGSEPKTDR